MAQPSACTITGFRSISRQFVAERRRRAPEKRAATRQNSSTASGRAWRAAAQERRDAQPCDEPRGLGRRRRAARRRPTSASASTCTPPAPIRTTGPNCSSWTMPSSISTPGAAIIGATSTRGSMRLGEIPPGCGDRGLVREAKVDAVQVGLVVDAALRGLQHDREPELARGGARCGLALDDAAGIGRQARRPAAASAHRSRRSAAPPASRARAAGEGGVRRCRQRRRARAREIAVVEQVAARRAGRTRAPSSTGNPSRVASTIMRVRRPCPADSRRGTPACREAAMARAQVVEVARMDAAARDAIVHDGAERRLRDRSSAWRSTAASSTSVIGPARAPGVERVDRRQARVEQRLELRGRGAARAA